MRTYENLKEVLLRVAAISGLFGGGYVATRWLFFTHYGIPELLRSAGEKGFYFFAFGIIAMCLYVFLRIALLLFGSTKNDRKQLMFRGVACGVGTVFLVLFTYMGNRIERQGLLRIARRAQPLVAAINQYERLHGEAPKVISDMVPDLLSSVPSPGIAVSPAYDYIRNDSRLDYGGSPWLLTVPIFTNTYSCASLVYFANHRPPKAKPGIYLSKYDDWVFIESDIKLADIKEY